MHQLAQKIAVALLLLSHSICCLANQSSNKIQHFSAGAATSEQQCGNACNNERLLHILTTAPTFAPVTLHPTTAHTYSYASTNSLDYFVAAFFFIAAAWLLLALLYSVLVIVIIRRRMRGELDIDDEDFGRMYFFGRRCFIPMGCVLRQYVNVLTERQNQGTEQTLRNMSREERRAAMEILLSRGTNVACENDSEVIDQEVHSDKAVEAPPNSNAGQDQKSNYGLEPIDYATDNTPAGIDNDSIDVQTCSICLMEYENFNEVFISRTCRHLFHHNCICDWLERRANTECPCCRNPLVLETEVWEKVKGLRRERRKRSHQQHRICCLSQLCCCPVKPIEGGGDNNADGSSSDEIHGIGTERLSDQISSELTFPESSSLPVADIEMGHFDIALVSMEIRDPP